MKIRTDFVTNSSSSSFIIAYRENPAEKYFDKMVELFVDTECNFSETDEGKIFYNEEDFRQFFLENYGEDYEEWFGTEIADAHSYFEKGFNIIRKRIDYCDDLAKDLLNLIAKDNDDFIIIAGENE